jgi:hypothetical protein
MAVKASLMRPTMDRVAGDMLDADRDRGATRESGRKDDGARGLADDSRGRWLANTRRRIALADDAV